MWPPTATQFPLLDLKTRIDFRVCARPLWIRIQDHKTRRALDHSQPLPLTDQDGDINVGFEDGNVFEAVQEGFDNTICVDMTAEANAVSATQVGSGNRLNALVTGSGNVARVTQTWDGHTAQIVQSGAGYMIDLSQCSR